MDWLGLRDLLFACVIFVPFERLVAMHPEQKIFRRVAQRSDLFLRERIVDQARTGHPTRRRRRRRRLGRPRGSSGRNRRPALLAPDRGDDAHRRYWVL